MGNIYLKLNNPSEALLYYRKEYSFAKDHKLLDLVSRSLSHIGRILVKSRKYKEAIAAFEEKVPLTDPIKSERAWLYHDLGRCQLELKNIDKALDYGFKCFGISDQLSDKRWSMNAKLLLAQSFGTFYLI